MNFSISSIMSKNIADVRAAESMHHVYFKMKQSYIKYMPVVDNDGQFVGVITDQDLNRPIPSKAKVSDYMNTNIGFTTCEEDLYEVTKRLLELKFSAVFVIEKKQVVGVITPADLLHALVPLLEAEQRPVATKQNTPMEFIANFFNQAGI